MFQHHILEVGEEGPAVRGAGGRLGVVLHGDDGLGRVTEALHGVIVEVDVGGLYILG